MCQGYLNVFENICCFVGESPADGFLELHEGDELQELNGASVRVHCVDGVWQASGGDGMPRAAQGLAVCLTGAAAETAARSALKLKSKNDCGK